MGFGNIFSGISDGVAILALAIGFLGLAIAIAVLSIEERSTYGMIKDLEWKVMIMYSSVFGKFPREIKESEKRKYTTLRRALHLQHTLNEIEAAILQKCSEVSTPEDCLSCQQDLESDRACPPNE